MSRIYTSADQLIGRTPRLELVHLEQDEHRKPASWPSWNISTPPEAPRTGSPRP